MSRFLLDSDTITLLEHGHPVVQANLALHRVSDIALPVISFQEKMHGWLGRLPRLKTTQQQADWYSRLVHRILPIWRTFEVISFDQSAILRFNHLKQQRLNIGLMDLRIAAIALEHSCIVVTHNTSDFSRIPGLTFVDWTV